MERLDEQIKLEQGSEYAEIAEPTKQEYSTGRLRRWWRENVKELGKEQKIAQRWGCSLGQLKRILAGQQDMSLSTAFKIQEDTGIPLLTLRKELIKLRRKEEGPIVMQGVRELEHEAQKIGRKEATLEFERNLKEREARISNLTIIGDYSDLDITEGSWLSIKASEDAFFPGGFNYLRTIDPGIEVAVAANVRPLIRPLKFKQGEFMADCCLINKQLSVRMIRLSGTSGVTIKKGQAFAQVTFFKVHPLKLAFQPKGSISTGGSY